MKELSAINVNTRTFELSFALVAFAIVIFLGILGLFIVVSHRQKKKRHLKALLRAKNLGPVLESKEIAHTTASKHYPQYLKTSGSRGHTPCPDIENPVVSDRKLRKLDVNELLAGIMVIFSAIFVHFSPFIIVSLFFRSGCDETKVSNPVNHRPKKRRFSTKKARYPIIPMITISKIFLCKCIE